jgi:2-oxoglutarate ferredoxin oxidoreductase subunit alpha
MQELDRLVDRLLVRRAQEPPQLGRARRPLLQHCFTDLPLERRELDVSEVFRCSGPARQGVERREQPTSDERSRAARNMTPCTDTPPLGELVLPAPQAAELRCERHERTLLVSDRPLSVGRIRDRVPKGRQDDVGLTEDERHADLVDPGRRFLERADPHGSQPCLPWHVRYNSYVASKPVEQLDSVVIRFAGDSGDGMQLTGGRFTSETALIGNDLATLPDFPAEIRAPAGSLPGVSGFQLHFADHDILTPGDQPNVLVAMNPAALKTNLNDLPPSGILVVDKDAFTDRNLQKAGYDGNPLEDGSLDSYDVHAIPLTSMTIEALKEIDGITKREAERSKNMFALGLMSWLYGRETESTIEFLRKKFAKRPEIAEANVKAFQTGYAFGETTESFAVQYEVKRAALKPGLYRNITGNQALAYGLIAASVKSGLPLFLGAYPITPASGVLEELARHKNFGVRTFQAEDEIAAVGAALGASFGGALGVSTSSGPGIVLKQETIGLAITLELPLVIVDIQRAGPSTGMPTKPEQADLLNVMFGRNSESPVPVIAAATPSDCFDAALEAARVAIKYRTPVFLLSDAYLANGSEPWLLPDVDAIPPIDPGFAEADGDGFQPYDRDEETLARPWAIPGTPGLEHRIGGLEKQDVTGNVSYDPENHDRMTRLRAQKVAGIAQDIPELEVDDPDGADTLVLSWGGTYGSVAAGVRRVRASGKKVAHAHLRYVNPFPRNTGEVVRGYKKVLVPEINLGQLRKLIRAEFLVDATGFNLVRGIPFRASEVAEAIDAMVDA